MSAILQCVFTEYKLDLASKIKLECEIQGLMLFQRKCPSWLNFRVGQIYWSYAKIIFQASFVSL
jgi:hypothetical protein